ncbi:MAG: response regulator [Pseudoclavibacter sp.]
MRVLLADDAALLREGLSLLLESAGHEVVMQISSASELLQAVNDLPSLDLVITDVRMPPHHGNDGLAAAIRVRREHPHLPILVLSQYVADAYAIEWLKESNELRVPAGLGYLLKESVSQVDDFLRSVDVISAGGIVFDPTVVRILLQPERGGGITELTPREREALAHMARGLSNNEIAAKMHLSLPGTTKHIGRVFDKLGLEQEVGNRRVLAVLKYLDEARHHVGLKAPQPE